MATGRIIRPLANARQLAGPRAVAQLGPWRLSPDIGLEIPSSRTTISAMAVHAPSANRLDPAKRSLEKQSSRAADARAVAACRPDQPGGASDPTRGVRGRSCARSNRSCGGSNSGLNAMPIAPLSYEEAVRILRALHALSEQHRYEVTWCGATMRTNLRPSSGVRSISASTTTRTPIVNR
jgi:hypothetical protein